MTSSTRPLTPATAIVSPTTKGRVTMITTPAPKFASGFSTHAVIEAELPEKASGVLYCVGGISAGFTVYDDVGLDENYNGPSSEGKGKMVVIGENIGTTGTANLAAIQNLKEYMAAELAVKDGELVVESKGLHLYGYAEELAKLRCLKQS